MQNLISILVVLQALGALLGTFAAIRGELVYIRAVRDGHIDHAERAHLRELARSLRFGMTLVLLASFGLVVAMYAVRAAVQPGVTDSYWTLIVLALLVILTARALSLRQMNFALGSAVAFTGWWAIAFLTLGWLPPLTFGAAVAFYAIAFAIMYGVLHYTRHLAVSLAHK
jgi:hypothetical protein